jgi:hypothetical protein
MRIGDSPREPLFPGRKKVRSTSVSDSSDSSQAVESRDEATSEGAGSEISELMVRLRELPDVREDVIAAVEERLKNGDLLTPEAAEETARQILEQLAAQATGA